MKLLICAGGTGGGVYPALSVLQALQHNLESGPAEDQSMIDVLWVGGEYGLEADLVRREGLPYESIPAAGLHGVGLRTLPKNVLQLVQGVIKSRQILGAFKPDVLLFTGGFVAMPMAFAAWSGIAGRPRPRSLVYVPDIEPGWALKALVRTADHVALTVEGSREYLPDGKDWSAPGYPTRRDLQPQDLAEAQQAIGVRPDLPVFLVMGGSKGAHSINQALFKVLPQLLESMQIIHASGQLAWEETQKVRDSLPAHLAARYRAFPYLHDEIVPALTAADLVLSRAGASCLGEYPQFALPAVLVPYPYAWRYQQVNASYLVDRGAALILKDQDLEDQLLPVIRPLIEDKTRLESMSQAMHSLAKPDAARDIARKILALVSKN